MQILSNLFNKKKEKTKKIISFDGGGVRVIAGIVFLKKLEVETGKKISDMFDMFVGTSAGAFNAACLAHGEMSAGELKTYWSKDYLERIMETSFFWDQASLIQARPRYGAVGLAGPWRRRRRMERGRAAVRGDGVGGPASRWADPRRRP